MILVICNNLISMKEKDGTPCLVSLLSGASGHSPEVHLLGRVDGHCWDSEGERLGSVFTNLQSEENANKQN